MNKQIETCPKCGRNITGEIDYGMAGSFAEGFTKGTVSSIGNSIFPGIGTILNATGLTSEAVHWTHKQITDSFVYNFNCPCGYIWSKRIKHTDEHIPDKCKKKRPGKIIGSIFWSISFILCLWYCIANPSTVDVEVHDWIFGDHIQNQLQWGWVGMCILAVITFFPAAGFIGSLIDNIIDFKTLTKISLKEFKESPLRKKYKQN
jgi:hypothetical protein